MSNKKLYNLILACLFALTIAFVATFQIAAKKLQQYKPIIEQKLSENSEYDISVKNIKLSLLGIKLAILLEDLSINDKIDTANKIRVGSVWAELNIIKSILTNKLAINRVIFNTVSAKLDQEYLEGLFIASKGVLSKGLGSTPLNTESISSILLKNSKLTFFKKDKTKIKLNNFNFIFTGFESTGFNLKGDTLIDKNQEIIHFSAKISDAKDNFSNINISLEVSTEKLLLNNIKNYIDGLNIDNGLLIAPRLIVDISNSNISKLSLLADIKDLPIDKANKVKFSNIDFNFDVTNQKIKLTLKDLGLQVPEYYSSTFYVQEISTEGRTVLENNILKSYTSEEFIIRFIDAKLDGSIKVDLRQSQPFYSLELQSNDKIQIATLDKYYPDVAIPKLKNWLVSSLTAGEMVENTFVLNNDGYAWSTKLSNVAMDYESDWPALKNLNADLNIKDNTLIIKAEQANINNSIDVSTLDAIFPNITDENSNLEIKGFVKSDFEKTLDFLKNSPLEQSVYQPIARLHPSGGVDLNLTLSLNFKNDIPDIEYLAKLKLADSSLDIKDYKLKIDKITGNLLIKNEVVKANNLELDILSNKARANINTITSDKDSHLIVDVVSDFDISKISNKYFPYFSKYLAGETPYSARVEVPLNNTKGEPVKLAIKSKLKGVEINLPKPLKKSKDTEIETTINLSIGDKSVVNANLDSFLSASMELKNEEISKAYLNIGNSQKTELPDKNIVLVGGEINNVDIKAWQELFGEDISDTAKLPYKANILINDFGINNYKFGSTWVGFDSSKKYFEFDGPKLKGTVDILDTKYSNSLKADLDYIYLNISNSSKRGMPFKLSELGNVYFSTKLISVNSRDLGSLKFNFFPTNSGYEVKDFVLKSQDYNVVASSIWDKTTNLSIFYTNANTKNAGLLLKKLGLSSSIAKGEGDVKVNVNWSGEILDFSPEILTGRADFNFKNGSILGVEPGIGKVLGLLSLDSIKRRLRLDFSDVFGKGLAFDKLEGGIQLTPNKAVIEEVVIEGPTANIELFGKSVISDKTLNLKMYVTPKITTGLPVAAAIAAGNPAVGAVFWLFDKAVSSKYSESVQYQYDISGTWNTPSIKSSKEVPVKKLK